MAHRSRASFPHSSVGRTRSWIPEVARHADAVVLLVLDGLGWNSAQEHAAILPTMHAHAGRPRSRPSAPSTTATALTSICDRARARAARRARLPDAGGCRRAQRAAVDRPRRRGRRIRSTCNGTRRSSAARSRSVTKSEFRNSGFSERAPARRAVHRLEHDGGARRALRSAGRGRRTLRLRVLPGRRQRRARVRPARRVLRARARVRGSPRRRPARGVARHARRCSSPPITARSIWNATTGSTSPSSGRWST